jgi:hypothetical protein
MNAGVESLLSRVGERRPSSGRSAPSTKNPQPGRALPQFVHRVISLSPQPPLSPTSTPRITTTTTVYEIGSGPRLHLFIVRSVRSANAHDDLPEPSLAPRSEPFKATESVQRLADKQRRRRRVGQAILHPCPCGDVVCFIGLLDRQWVGVGVEHLASSQLARNRLPTRSRRTGWRRTRCRRCQ